VGDYPKDPTEGLTASAGASDVRSEKTGGCQCGAVRYELTGDPLPLAISHCNECQKQTARAFGMSLPVAKQICASCRAG
jgi:hypothetical protein